MTVEAAFAELIYSESFKEIAKQRTTLGNKYRVQLSRYNAGKLKFGAMAETLKANGYVINANREAKRRSVEK